MTSIASLSTTTTLQDNGPYSLNTGPHAPRQFPPEVNLYSGGTFSRAFYLGPHQEQPLYAVSTHSGWSGKADVVLHATADGAAKSPVMATYKADALHLRAAVVLPGGDERTVKYTGLTARGRAFEAATGGGGKREQFEWSTGWGGGSGRGLGASDTQGRRLVRGSTGETVATSAPAATSGRKQFAIQFVGSGASGELGEEFAVLAVISALGMWDQSRRRNRTGPIAGAFSGGGGVVNSANAGM
ncbi:uncharacterized protein E0L32_007733 [Thyridium curvatum]|uniref:Uncharacterized protein n=1 Tax=Thyridium curvatum TaxID=1093900 RepID=A0A507ANN3_9PEZI|nr:uncharacterized protein E0L32_007733 [Thyridium curvatum]TPX11522.1 hypothetical protein E0L32_007733 [Thyridium curvatum]